MDQTPVLGGGVADSEWGRRPGARRMPRTGHVCSGSSSNRPLAGDQAGRRRESRKAESSCRSHRRSRGGLRRARRAVAIPCRTWTTWRVQPAGVKGLARVGSRDRPVAISPAHTLRDHGLHARERKAVIPKPRQVAAGFVDARIILVFGALRARRSDHPYSASGDNAASRVASTSISVNVGARQGGGKAGRTRQPNCPGAE